MTVKPGAFRFNTDSMKLEIFRGADVGIGTLAAGQWEEIQATSPDVQTGGTRGLFGGYIIKSITDEIDYINIDSTGNAIDFGNLHKQEDYSGGICIKNSWCFWRWSNSNK